MALTKELHISTTRSESAPLATAGQASFTKASSF